MAQHHQLADMVLARIAAQGPIRSADLDDAELGAQSQSTRSQTGSAPSDSAPSDSAWTNKLGTRLLEALWSAGQLAVSERRAFHRSFDLPERVIPNEYRTASRLSEDEAIAELLFIALRGHGFASTGTLAATWRLRNRRAQIERALGQLTEEGLITPSVVQTPERDIKGWVTTDTLDSIDQLAQLRPRRDRGVLLSPFDPLLWDRTRTRQLFGFDLVIEIYKPAAQRQFGYYCLPVLSGDRLIGRVDLKADRKSGSLNVLSRHFENDCDSARDRAAYDWALNRFAASVSLTVSTQPLAT